MPPKKIEAKPKVVGEEVEGEDPAVLLANYQKFSKSIGLPVHVGIVKALSDVEKLPIDQLIVDDEYGALGPGGTRALMTSILGTGPGMKGGPYKLLKSLRIWKSNVGDDGASAIVSLRSLSRNTILMKCVQFPMRRLFKYFLLHLCTSNYSGGGTSIRRSRSKIIVFRTFGRQNRPERSYCTWCCLVSK